MTSLAISRWGIARLNGSTLYPSIYYTGRLFSDPLGMMETESSIINGTGSETGCQPVG